MAVTEVNLLFTSRGATDDLRNHRTYTRVYEVLTDDPDDDEQVVGNASADGVTVPIPGDALDSDAGAICVGVDPEQSDDSPMIWLLTAHYDSDPPTATGQGGAGADKPDGRTDFQGNEIAKGERQANPLNEPATWTLSFEDSEQPAVEVLKVDGAGNLVIEIPPNWTTAHAYALNQYVRNGVNVYVCTTAGTSAGAGGPAGVGTGIADNTAVWAFYATFAQSQNDPNKAVRTALLTSGKLPFDPPVMVPISKLVLCVTANMPLDVGNMQYLLSIKNALNQLAWHGIPPRCAKVKNATHDGGKVTNGIGYVTTKWEIALDADTHDLRVLDAGYGCLQTRTDPATSLPVVKYIRFTDVNGEPIDQPVPMNGAGRPLEPGDPPVFLRFVPRQNRIIDFNTQLPF